MVVSMQNITRIHLLTSTNFFRRKCHEFFSLHVKNLVHWWWMEETRVFMETYTVCVRRIFTKMYEICSQYNLFVPRHGANQDNVPTLWEIASTKSHYLATKTQKSICIQLLCNYPLGITTTVQISPSNTVY